MSLSSHLMSVKAAPMQHTIPCVGYVVQEDERAGRLNIEKIRPLVEQHKAGMCFSNSPLHS